MAAARCQMLDCRGGGIAFPLSLVLIGLISLSGCGGQSATVEGKITLDGNPVEGSPEMYGTVSFYHEGGGGAPAIGIIKQGGKYALSVGAQHELGPGPYVVGVSIMKVLPPLTEGGQTRPQQFSPRRYASPGESGFKADVKPGSNTFDFALQSK